MKFEQAQLVPLFCPNCGAQEILEADDAVFFFCRNCKTVLEPRKGELATVHCLWQKPDRDPAQASLYIPFWVFATEVSVDPRMAQRLALTYPADFMVPASVSADRSVTIVRLADSVTREAVQREYTDSKLDLNVELGKYSREDAREAVELIFLSIERELFSEAPGTKYEVKPTYKDLCFLVWEKSKLNLLYVPDEHILLRETAFEEEVETEERIEDFVSLLSKTLTRKRYRF